MPPLKSLNAPPNRLPPELWEAVILRLHPSEILRLRLVNHHLRHLIDNSPELQYQLDLYSAGLEDGPRGSSFSLPERRERLEQYLSGWENIHRSHHSCISVPEGYDGYDEEIYGGVAAYVREGPDEGIHFIRLPSPAKGITTKQWTIRDLPAVDFDVEVEPELDLIVMTENVAQQPHTLHFLRMSDGKPHPDAFSPTIPLDSLQFYPTPVLDCHLLIQTGVRILLVLWNEDGYGYGIIIDWRTGERGKPWRSPPYEIGQKLPTLIDDHRILTTLNDEDTGIQSLALLDTASISEDTRVPTTVAFELPQGASFCVSDYSVARVPRHTAPFCRDHSRHIPVLIPIIIPHEEADHMGDLYVMASDRILSLMKKFEGSARVPWEEWKDSLTFVGDTLPRAPPSYSTHGLVLFVDMVPFFVPGATPGVSFRVYNCGPRVRHTPLGVTGNAGLPYSSSKPFFNHFELQDSETVTDVRYSEDNIIIHTTTEGAEETKVHFLSF